MSMPGLRAVLAVLAWVLGTWAHAAPSAAEAPPVYPEPGGQGPVLVYVGADGLGLQTVTRENVVARWGAPDSVHAPRYVRRTDSGGYVDLRYPSLGLFFQVNAEDNDDSGSSRIGWLKVTLPYAGRTPQGLFLGMPEAEAMAIIQQHYKVRGSINLFYGQSYRQVPGRSQLASNHGWRKTQSATFDFRQGRLHAMHFQLKPTPLVSRRDIRELKSFVVLIAFVGLFGFVTQRVRERLGPWWDRGRTALGVVLLGVAGLGAVLTVSMLGGSSGFEKLLGLLFALGAVGLGVVGLILLSRAAHGGVSLTAKAILVVGLLLMALAGFFG
jgi:hypothetical protein